jgi:hypothetical protein
MTGISTLNDESLLPFPGIVDLDAISIVLVPPSDKGADEFPLCESGFVLNEEINVILIELLLFFRFIHDCILLRIGTKDLYCAYTNAASRTILHRRLATRLPTSV